MQHFKLIYFFMLWITSARVSFSCSNDSFQANLRCWSDEIFRTRLAELSDLAIEILLSFFAQPFGGSVWVEALLQEARPHGFSAACEIVQEMIWSP